MNYWPAEEARRQTRWYDCALLSSNQRRREGRRERDREAERKEGLIRKRKGGNICHSLEHFCMEIKRRAERTEKDGG